MNLLQIILKNMRQRALGTWLTLLSVTLGVAMAVAVLIVQREGKSLFGQSEYGYDVIVGINRGSPTQLVMNTVYQIDQSPGNIPYSVYEDLAEGQYRRQVKIAVPVAVGDSYMNHRILATTPKMFGYADDGVTRLAPDDTFEYIKGRQYEFETGKCFHADKFEAVIGSDVTPRTGLDIGQQFQVTHGLPQEGAPPDVHEEKWTVVGRLEKTGTAADRVIFIPLTTFYCIAEHEEGLSAQAMIRAGIDPAKITPEIQTQVAPDEATTVPDADHDDHDDHAAAPATMHAADDHDDHDDHGHAYEVRPDGTVKLHMPKNEWALSAVLVKARGGDASAAQAMQLMYLFRVRNEALAVSPAVVMREFFDTFLKGSTQVLLLVSALVTIVAAVGILVSIYNSVAARQREIAVLRALGATRSRVLAIICLEAGLIGLAGAVLGLLVGHTIAAITSGYLNAFLGQGINWALVGGWEVLYLAGVAVLATLAGLVPAATAYKVPVATNLT
jgi:putative ABC transport system permease protein